MDSLDKIGSTLKANHFRPAHIGRSQTDGWAVRLLDGGRKLDEPGEPLTYLIAGLARKAVRLCIRD